jgi:hypothetical protein
LFKEVVTLQILINASLLNFVGEFNADGIINITKLTPLYLIDLIFMFGRFRFCFNFISSGCHLIFVFSGIKVVPTKFKVLSSIQYIKNHTSLLFKQAVFDIQDILSHNIS